MRRIRCLWANTDAVECSRQKLRIQARFVTETGAERVEIAETLKALIRKKANYPKEIVISKSTAGPAASRCR
jgi:hypothetical protein